MTYPPRTRSRATATISVVVALLTLPAFDAKFNVRKCCPSGQGFIYNTNNELMCQKINNSEVDKAPDFRVPECVNSSGEYNVYNVEQYKLSYGVIECDNPFFMRPRKDPDESFSITESGDINVNEFVYSSREFNYCFEEEFHNDSWIYIAQICQLAPYCQANDLRQICECIPGVYNERCPAPTHFPYIYFMTLKLKSLWYLYFIFFT